MEGLKCTDIQCNGHLFVEQDSAGCSCSECSAVMGMGDHASRCSACDLEVCGECARALAYVSESRMFRMACALGVREHCACDACAQRERPCYVGNVREQCLNAWACCQYCGNAPQRDTNPAHTCSRVSISSQQCHIMLFSIASHLIVAYAGCVWRLIPESMLIIDAFEDSYDATYYLAEALVFEGVPPKDLAALLAHVHWPSARPCCPTFQEEDGRVLEWCAAIGLLKPRPFEHCPSTEDASQPRNKELDRKRRADTLARAKALIPSRYIGGPPRCLTQLRACSAVLEVDPRLPPPPCRYARSYTLPANVTPAFATFAGGDDTRAP